MSVASSICIPIEVNANPVKSTTGQSIQKSNEGNSTTSKENYDDTSASVEKRLCRLAAATEELIT